MTSTVPPGSRHAPPAGLPRPPVAGPVRRPDRTAARPATWLRREPAAVRFDRREAAVAAGIYLAVAAVGFTTLLLITRHMGYGTGQVIGRWDSRNYLSIAEHGYPHRLRLRPDGVPRWSTLAFFPLVPALIRAAHLTGLPFTVAGVAVSWAAATLAAVAVHTLARSLAGRRTGYACVGLWAASPYAFALWVPYSEACFSAALLWALTALVARRWAAAGALAALAGLMRPTAAVLVVVVAACAGRQALRRRDGWRPYAALALAPAGLLGSWLWIGLRAGRLDGWFEAERAWGQSFDFGLGTARFLGLVALYRQHADIRFGAVVLLIGLVGCGVLALGLDRRTPWPLVLALAGAWALMVGTPGSPLSKPRFMLPFLPLVLLLPARPVARLPRAVQGCLYACGAVFAGWYAVGLLVLFRWSP